MLFLATIEDSSVVCSTKFITLHALLHQFNFYATLLTLFQAALLCNV